MNVIYTGKPPEFTAAQQKKADARFARIGKLVDGRGEKEVHVFFASERYLTKAEATLNYQGHSAVGTAAEPDPAQALAEAIARLEKQVLKLRAKWRDTHRGPAAKKIVAKAAPAPETKQAEPPTIKRVTVGPRRKPMTVDEALLMIGRKDSYLPFRDVETGSVSVLVRRSDGHFDLIET
jgi:putative sigma-54 modulation protein